MDVSNQLLKALKDTCELLNRTSIDYCLIGGLAVGMVSAPRATEDIDFLIAIDETKKNGIEDLLEEKFKLIQSKETIHFKKASIWRLILRSKLASDSELLVLDFIFADNDIYKQAIQESITIDVDDVQIPVASLENLIRIKQLSGREKDLQDIRTLETFLD